MNEMFLNTNPTYDLDRLFIDKVVQSAVYSKSEIGILKKGSIHTQLRLKTGTECDAIDNFV